MRKVSAPKKPSSTRVRRGGSRPPKRGVSQKKRTPPKAVQVTAENRLVVENGAGHVPCRESKLNNQASIHAVSPWTAQHLRNNFVGVWRELVAQERLNDVTRESWPDDIRLARKPPSLKPAEEFVTSFPSHISYSRIMRSYENAQAQSVPIFEEEGPLRAPPKFFDTKVSPRRNSPPKESEMPPPLKRDRRRPLHDLIIKPTETLTSHHVCDGSEKWFHAEFTWDKFIDEINTSVFGNESFRELQREIINAVLARNDVFAMLPTGGGKSLCYQVAGLTDSGITIVVMPLVSLMQDQCDILSALDVGVENLSGNLSRDETKRIYDLLENPGGTDEAGRGIVYNRQLKFVFVTPEKIGASESLMDLLSRLYAAGRLSRFVIDEAHCVSQWGNDFRPDYQKLKVLRDNFPDVPILAMTASATMGGLEDIIKQLGMRNTQVFRKSFNRSNLIYSVKLRSTTAITTNFIDQEIVPLLTTKFNSQCGIIYCFSRNNCEEVAQRLCQKGIQSETYHAGMSINDREIVQRRWMAKEFLVIVATIAFGMGINKKDCRFVIHLAMPKSIESFYQESGRAGRDGQPAYCILYYDPKDKQKHLWLSKQTSSAPVERGLLEMLNFCQDNISCRRKLILEHFGESFDHQSCDLPCDNCSADTRSKYVEVSCVEEVNKILEVISLLQTGNFAHKCPGLTLLDVKALLMGVKFKKLPQIQARIDKLQALGFLKNRGWSHDDTLRLLNKMIACKILSERVQNLPHNGVAVYLGIGQFAYQSERLLPRFCVAKESQKKSEDTTTTTEGASSATEESLSQVQRDLLFTELVALRQNLANQLGVQNVIISMDGLQKMVTHLPTDLVALRQLNIPNFTSKAKIEKYGLVFTHHISMFLDRVNNLEPDFERMDSFRSAQSKDDLIDLDEIE